MIVAALLSLLSQQRRLANDALLAMISHTTLATGLILATALPGIRMDLLGLLYGDILAINITDIMWIYVTNIIVLALLIKLWSPLLSITTNESLAAVEGVNVVRLKWVLMMMMAIVFAIAMKLIGVLLITALLIIPASAARQFAKTPEQMAFIASLLGIVSVMVGILFSGWWDWPAGPAIVVVSTLLFVLSLIFSALIPRYLSCH
jgi:zinc transport system permease protein